MTDVPFLWTDPNPFPGQRPDQLIVIFRETAEKNTKETAEKGYDVFDNVLVAEVSAGGHGAKSSVVHEIERKSPDGTVKQHPVYSRKYAQIIQQFKEGRTDEGMGTPLHLLPKMDPARIATLKAQGIHFVETLATAGDSSALGEMMGFREMRTNAQKFIELREKNAPMVKAEEIEKRLTAENENLRRQLEELAARFTASETPKRGPGRPRKEEQEEAA